MDIDMKDVTAKAIEEEAKAIALRVGRSEEEVYDILSSYITFYKPQMALWLTEMHFVYGAGAYKHESNKKR